MLMKMPALKNLSAFEDAQGNIEEVQYSSKMLIMESVSTFDEHVRDFPLRHRTRAALEGIRDSLEKMILHQMAALHYGMMRATALMNKELDAAGGTAIDAAGDKRDLTASEREAANVRACRLAGAISRMSATCQQGLLTLQRKRTDGNQHVTVKHIHQQVNVTEGGQAVVAGDKVTSRENER